jgi:hypothetical protein
MDIGSASAGAMPKALTRSAEHKTRCIDVLVTDRRAVRAARGHYMVKIVLIGKNWNLHCLYGGGSHCSFGLEFILNETPRVMVNPAFASRALIADYRA